MVDKIDIHLKLSIVKYDQLKELKEILLSWKINWEEFITRTEEFLSIYKEYPYKGFKEFYEVLNSSYIDKMEQYEENHIYRQRIETLLANPANNRNYEWDKNLRNV